MPISCLLPPHNDSILESFLNGQWDLAVTRSYNQLVENACGSQDWDEMSLFGSSITLSEYTAGDLFWFGTLLSSNTFSHPQASFPWSSICSLKGIFISPKKWCTDILEPREQKDARCSIWKLLILIVKLLHTFLICREGDCYCWQNHICKFSNGSFYVFSHQSLSKVSINVSKFTLFCIDVPWRFYLAIKSHLPRSWQNRLSANLLH